LELSTFVTDHWTRWRILPFAPVTAQAITEASLEDLGVAAVLLGQLVVTLTASCRGILR